MQIKTGIGLDTHRFVEGRPCILGGVTVPHTLGLLGHSDADVLAHAIMDAILGAISAGDIGQLFPDSDPIYAGANSLNMLSTVAAIARAGGWTISHVDSTVMAEQPKLAPHVYAMRQNLAKAIGIPVNDVSVKATTVEKMGSIGREEGIGALAIATVTRS